MTTIHKAIEKRTMAITLLQEKHKTTSSAKQRLSLLLDITLLQCQLKALHELNNKINNNNYNFITL